MHLYPILRLFIAGVNWNPKLQLSEAGVCHNSKRK